MGCAYLEGAYRLLFLPLVDGLGDDVRSLVNETTRQNGCSLPDSDIAANAGASHDGRLLLHAHSMVEVDVIADNNTVLDVRVATNDAVTADSDEGFDDCTASYLCAHSDVCTVSDGASGVDHCVWREAGITAKLRLVADDCVVGEDGVRTNMDIAADLRVGADDDADFNDAVVAYRAPPFDDCTAVDADVVADADIISDECVSFDDASVADGDIGSEARRCVDVDICADLDGAQDAHC